MKSYELRGIDVGRDVESMPDEERYRAELRSVVWLEMGWIPGETAFDTAIRVAVKLGVRCEGALTNRLHGPIRSLCDLPDKIS